jgi:hypothetical protein
VSDANEQECRQPIPVEVEIYVNADGSVTFADLEEMTVWIARSLDPEQPSIGTDSPEAGHLASENDVESD